MTFGNASSPLAVGQKLLGSGHVFFELLQCYVHADVDLLGRCGNRGVGSPTADQQGKADDPIQDRPNSRLSQNSFLIAIHRSVLDCAQRTTLNNYFIRVNSI